MPATKVETHGAQKLKDVAQEHGQPVIDQAKSAAQCWRHWHSAELTPHDGLVQAEHPALIALLGRTQSCTR